MGQANTSEVRTLYDWACIGNQQDLAVLRPDDTHDSLVLRIREKRLGDADQRYLKQVGEGPGPLATVGEVRRLCAAIHKRYGIAMRSPADRLAAAWRIVDDIGSHAWGQRISVVATRLEELPAEPAGEPSTATKPKRSTERGEGQVKLIASLTKHHNYAAGSCLNLEPIGINQLARLADVSNSTASTFIKKQFGERKKYRAKCTDAGTLADAIKVITGEITPAELTQIVANAFKAGKKLPEGE